MKHIVSLVVALLVVLLTVAPVATADVPGMMNYQGHLTDEEGAPLDTTISMTFTIYDDSTGGSSFWTETQPSVTVSNGLFNVLLGSETAITEAAFDETERWLQITVEGEVIEPRTRLVSAPYAFQVATVDGATGGVISGDVNIQSDLTVSGKATIGPGHTNTGMCAFVAGITNEASGDWSTVGGGQINTASGFHTTVGGGLQNTASYDDATVAGGTHNTASGSESTVGGGTSNTASGYLSTVSGGSGNTASGQASTIGGGNRNVVEGFYSAILGGYRDTITATADYSYLFGIGSKLTEDSTFMVDMPHIRFGDESNGYEFPTSDGSADQVMATDGSGQLSWTDVSGGGGGWVDDGTVVRLETSTDNVGIGTTEPSEKLDVDGNIHASGTITSGSSITIDGANDKITATSGTIDFDDEDIITTGRATFGPNNRNLSISGFVAGEKNWVSGSHSTVGGGSADTASGNHSTVGGGWLNTASGDYSTVGGGWLNTASGVGSPNWSNTVGGGMGNTASGGNATVGGGGGNKASGGGATVGGGELNTASGVLSTVAGGQLNLVEGSHSAILGGNGDTITATADYSYLFGIASKLTEDSTFMVDMPHIRFGDETNGYEFPTSDGSADQVMATDGSGQLSWTTVSGSGGGWVDDGTVVRLETSTDQVGIGTTSPDANLHIQGSGFERLKVESTISNGIAEVELKTTGGNYAYLKLYKGGPTTGGSTAGVPLADLSLVAAGAHAGPLMLQVITYNPMYFVTANQERMRITGDGNVGIGTDSPTEKLDVDGNIHASGTLTSGGSITIDGVNHTITSTSDTISFDDETIVIRTTSARADKLDVPGNKNGGGGLVLLDTADGDVEHLTGKGIFFITAGEDTTGIINHTGTRFLDTAEGNSTHLGPHGFRLINVFNPAEPDTEVEITKLGARFFDIVDEDAAHVSADGLVATNADGDSARMTINQLLFHDHTGDVVEMGVGLILFHDHTGDVVEMGVGLNGPYMAMYDSDGDTAVDITKTGIKLYDSSEKKRLELKNSDGSIISVDAGDADRVVIDNYGISLKNYLGSNTIVLNSNNGRILAVGAVGIGVDSATQDLDVDGAARFRGLASGAGTDLVIDANGVMKKKSSSKRYKQNIRKLEADASHVFELEPVRFEWKSTGEEDIGLIAEEVEQILPDLVIYDSEGRPDAVKYDRVALYLLSTIKDLKAENDALKAQLSELSAVVQTILAKQNSPKSGDEKLTINR